MKKKNEKILKIIFMIAKIIPLAVVFAGIIRYIVSIEDKTNKNTDHLDKLQSSFSLYIKSDKDTNNDLENRIISLQSSLSGYVQQKWWLRDNDLYKGDFRQDEEKENNDIKNINMKIENLSYQVYINSGKLEILKGGCND